MPNIPALLQVSSTSVKIRFKIAIIKRVWISLVL